MNTELARFSPSVDWDRVNARMSLRDEIRDIDKSLYVLHECKYRYYDQCARGQITRERRDYLVDGIFYQLDRFNSMKKLAQESLDKLRRNR